MFDYAKGTDGNSYIVETILVKRRRADVNEYFIKWSGLESVYSSWVTERDLECPNQVDVS